MSRKKLCRIIGCTANDTVPFLDCVHPCREIFKKAPYREPFAVRRLFSTDPFFHQRSLTPASPAPPATAPSLRRWASASSAQSPLAFVSACGENIVRSLAPPLPTQTKFAREPSSGDWLPSSFYSSVSSSACHSAIFASLGIRQSPRGERATEPTLGPSGTQLRLNCWLKKRR